VAVSRGGDPQPAAASTGSDSHKVRFLDHLADELGIGRAELVAAIARAADATIDDLEGAGLLTGAQAEFVRDAVRRAVTNPSALKGLLRRSTRRLAPYRALAHGLKQSVARSLASLLKLDERELARLFARSKLSEAAAAAGVTRAQVLDATRRAARAELAPALARGLLTRVQARILVHKAVWAVAHHW
jgi:hypothetical protein